MNLQEQFDALAARVARLEADRWTGPRLGPQPETQAQIDARTQRLVDALKEAPPKAPPPPVDRSALCTTDGRSPAEARASQTNETGQHASYIVLCEDERKKGFVRPYRDAYRHLGVSRRMMSDMNEEFDGPRHGGCGGVTTMGRALSETYARDPGFYGATFCVGCNRHLPVAEFVWTADGQQVGS